MSFSSVKYTKGGTDFVRFGEIFDTVSNQTVADLNPRENDLVAPLFSYVEIDS